MFVLGPFLLWCYCAVASLFNQKTMLPKWLYLTLIVFSSTLISAYFSLDSVAYQSIFKHYSESGFSAILNEVYHYEAFFLILAKLLAGLPSIIFFVIIASLSFCLKLTLIERVSRDAWLSLLVFFSFFFVLHDGTGIRVSLAIAVAFWGLYFLSEKRWGIFFVLVIVAATCIHYSLFVFLALFFLRSKHTAYGLIAFWAVLIIAYFYDYQLTSLLRLLSGVLGRDLPVVNKFYGYLHRPVGDAAPYSMFFLGLFVASLYVFFRFKEELTEFEMMAFNSVILSFVILALFSETSSIQNRLSEVFRVAIVFVFPLYYRALVEIVHFEKLAKVITHVGLCGYFMYFAAYKGLIVL